MPDFYLSGALTHSLIVVRFVVDGGLNDGGLNVVFVVVHIFAAGAEEPQRNPYTISSRIDKGPQAYIP